MYNDEFLGRKLDERKENNAFRQLRLPEGKIDFCSNDYLGLARSGALHVADFFAAGATGSRLLAGNYELAEQVEKEIATFHQAETALLFNSGYDANVGVLSSVPQRGDVVLYDFLSHASIRDGIRLSFAQSYSFLHNDMADLERRLQQVKDLAVNIFVVTETVFSMDGDQCPLPELVALCKKYNAHLIVDEAHATGVIGEKGEGLVQYEGLQDEIFCRVQTFGKGCGCHGAAVLGSANLRSYLINFARSFIYTTALPPHAVAVIQRSYATFPGMQKERAYLHSIIRQFQSAELAYEKLPSQTPIQIVIVPGNEAVKALAEKLQSNGLDVRPILYPTVPKGKERLRIVLHAFNTEEEMGKLIDNLS
jgi:8-amino-7-oxononanoate synthase